MYLVTSTLKYWVLVTNLLLGLNSWSRGTEKESSSDELPWKYFEKTYNETTAVGKVIETDVEAHDQ